MDAVAFGTRRAGRPHDGARARHAPAGARRAAEAAGPFPAGTPYRGDDPELLLWILGRAGRVGDARLRASTSRTLSRDELDALWRDYRVVGRRFGLREREMPRDIDGFEAYMAERTRAASCSSRRRRASWRSTSCCTRRSRCTCAPLLELVNQITVGLLPAARPRPVRLLAGTRCAPSRCTAARSTSSAWSCPCCPSGCGCCRWRARPRRAARASARRRRGARSRAGCPRCSSGGSTRLGRVLVGDRAAASA